MGVEGVVTETGKTIAIADAENDPRFSPTVFDDQGFKTKTMVCVPLNNARETIGCIEIINSSDGKPFLGLSVDTGVASMGYSDYPHQSAIA